MSGDSLLKKYASETSLHGVQFVLLNDRHWTTKIFWTIAIISSFFMFGYYLQNSYRKWLIEPDISTKIQQKFAKEIPFPAITVCTPLFARYDTVKFMEPIENLTIEQQNFMSASMKICHPFKYDYLSKLTNRSEKNVAKIINQTFLRVDEVLPYCSMVMLHKSCVGIFNRVLTSRGLCYSFNMQGFNEIFDISTISDDFQSYKREKIKKSFNLESEMYEKYFNDNETISQWTLDKGFTSDHLEDSVPMAATEDSMISFKIRLNGSNLLNMCPHFSNQMSFFIHLPNQIMTFLDNPSKVDFNKTKTIKLHAKWQKTNEDLRIIQPKIRGCYFEDERKLEFFKNYLKNHCEIECLANYTLQKCGCVHFSMPRNSTTATCDSVSELKCFNWETREWPVYEHEIDEPCGCLKNCNEINYLVKSETEVDGVDHTESDRGMVHFKFYFNERTVEVFESIMTYKFQNFISDVGGLLGLFLGCSVLSIVEIFYYLSLAALRSFKRDSKIKSIQQCCCENQIKEIRERISRHDALLSEILNRRSE